MRPRSLAEYVGQEHVLGAGKLLRRAIESKVMGSMIFYGPPSSGKTTLAYVASQPLLPDPIMATRFSSIFRFFPALFACCCCYYYYYYFAPPDTKRGPPAQSCRMQHIAIVIQKRSANSSQVPLMRKILV